MTKCNEVHPGGKQRDAAVLFSSQCVSAAFLQCVSGAWPGLKYVSCQCSSGPSYPVSHWPLLGPYPSGCDSSVLDHGWGQLLKS